MAHMRADDRHERRAVWSVRLLVLVVALVVPISLGLSYLAAGWYRMDQTCSTEAAVPEGGVPETVSYAWTWEPLGFTCTWAGAVGGDDVSRTKLWW